MRSYTGHDEKVIEAYGEENNNFLRRVKEDYDPVGTFTNLVSGGFKFPAPPGISARSLSTSQDRFKVSLSYWGESF